MEIKPATLSRTLWAVSVPLIFAEISETILHVSDTLFLARVGTVEVGAIALGDTILEIWVALTVGLVDGLQILLARRMGQGRPEEVGGTFNRGLALLTGVSTLLTVALVAAAPYLGFWLVGSSEVGAAVSSFLGAIAFGIVFNSANLAYSALLVSLERTRVLIGATIVLALTNLAFDYVLIFGALGFPALGIRGAALGSVGAEIATFIFLSAYVLRRLDVSRYGLFRVIRWSGGSVRLLARISSPVALQALLEGVRWFAFFLILERVGEGALAASNIVYSCFALLLIPTEGFAESACSMVSKVIGSGQAGRIGAVMREAVSQTYLMTLPFAALVFIFPDLVLSLVTSDPEMVEMSRASLRLVALAMLVIIPAEMWAVGVSGTGDTQAGFVIEVALTALMLAGTWLSAIVMEASLEYVWATLPLAWAACLALSYAWVTSGRWRRVEI